ncbi:single-stranded-DNA-specific exonuclease RecJ [Candidatus Kaiserbacteria bacterium]|nr:single-stranded-DNA-specific exonuclease RecJ [Candidatus Kaiserbacteria bacterium]
MISDLVRSLLFKRGVEKDEDIQAFLSPDYATHTHSPFLMAGMEVAVVRVLHAIEKGERIAIYADFDCDGIPGAAILHDLFKKIGYDNVEIYIPHRDREGYGFHIEAIEKLVAQGVALIITVDVGTKANNAVAFAKRLGVDVIVTDHHEIDSELPNAVAVLNPKIVPPALSGVDGYPFPHLCGAATAWKLAQALLIEGKKRDLEAFSAIPEGWEKWLLDLVAIATVADLVPLTGENRVLTHWGLKVLRKSPRPGIIALCSALRINRAYIDETDVAFSFAPRINAASRMDSPELAFELLTTADSVRAEELALKLESLNRSRKGVVAGIVKDAKKKVHARFGAEDRVVVLGDPDWKPSLLGLAANSIVEERGGAAVLWGRDGLGKLKGSARSDGSISIVELFSRSGAFVEYGGHRASGGFTISTEAIHTLPEVLKQVAAQLDNAPKEEEVPNDAIVTLREISLALLKDVSQLAPFGIGNAKPIFRIPRVRITHVRRFGKEGNHTEVSLICSETGTAHRAFQFFKAPEHFSTMPVPDMQADILATMERDTYRGPDRMALRLVDILAS